MLVKWFRCRTTSHSRVPHHEIQRGSTVAPAELSVGDDCSCSRNRNRWLWLTASLSSRIQPHDIHSFHTSSTADNHLKRHALPHSIGDTVTERHRPIPLTAALCSAATRPPYHDLTPDSAPTSSSQVHRSLSSRRSRSNTLRLERIQPNHYDRFHSSYT